MKKLIALLFILGSVSSHAHGIKRLTTTKCLSEDFATTVLVKWDSSITIVGPVLVEINGEKVNPVFTLGDDLGIQGQLANGTNYAATISGPKKSKTNLILGNDSIELECNTKTKFRIY